MVTKIKSVTIISQPGTRTYRVGAEINGLDLDRIEDRSIDFPDALHIIYQGFTSSGDLVFEVINAPVDVEYEAA